MTASGAFDHDADSGRRRQEFAMHVRDDQPSDGIVRTDRRRLLEAGGVLAGAAALLGNAPAANATDRANSAIATRRSSMPTWRPDPTFYPSPRSAMQAP